MSQNVQQHSGGIGFCGLLTVLFIGLKLTGYITWSWWWVLSPLWIPFAIVALIFLGIGLVFLIGALLNDMAATRARRIAAAERAANS